MSVRTMSLQDHNYDVTEGECPDCEEGHLWVNSYELVCERCDRVFRKSNRRTTSLSYTILSEFTENRDDHEYDNSGKIRMPGGFNEAYEGDGIYGDFVPEDA